MCTLQKKTETFTRVLSRTSFHTTQVFKNRFAVDLKKNEIKIHTAHL